jgi:hypothetical protein
MDKVWKDALVSAVNSTESGASGRLSADGNEMDMEAVGKWELRSWTTSAGWKLEYRDAVASRLSMGLVKEGSGSN